MTRTARPTLVVSDLHLGARGSRALLADPGPRRVLAEAVAGAGELVLLGDVLELRGQPVRDALARARPALEAIAQARPDGAPLRLLAGNHDHALIAPWLRARDAASPLGLAAEVGVDPGAGPLAELVARLGPDGLTVHYPGLRAGPVWLTHGHYGDRHTTVPALERLGAGVGARLARGGAGDPRRAEDYEAALAPVYAWIDATSQFASGAGHEGGASAGLRARLTARGGSPLTRARRVAERAGFAATIAGLSRAGLGPLRPDLSGAALRDAGLSAMAQVVTRLGVDAEHVVFGHTHRAGRLPEEAPGRWRTAGGVQLHNVGCWVREPHLTGRDPSHSPYRPGFAAWLDPAGATPPRLVNLLDD